MCTGRGCRGASCRGGSALTLDHSQRVWIAGDLNCFELCCAFFPAVRAWGNGVQLGFEARRTSRQRETSRICQARAGRRAEGPAGGRRRSRQRETRQGKPCTLSLRRWAVAEVWVGRRRVGGHGARVGDGGGEGEGGGGSRRQSWRSLTDACFRGPSAYLDATVRKTAAPRSQALHSSTITLTSILTSNTSSKSAPNRETNLPPHQSPVAEMRGTIPST